MAISVVNRHAWKGNGTYIGRGGVFGNKYTHLPIEGTQAEYQVATREEAIECYRTWALEQWDTNSYFKLALASLVKQHLRGEDIVLVCSCKPAPCHGDVLKQLIEFLADMRVVSVNDEFKDKDGDLPF